MQFQLAGVNERLGAVRALMRLCRGMCRFHVVPQIPRLGELLVANTALICLAVARMNQRVRLQVAWVCEPFLAERALERPLSRMRVRVNLQCLGAHKRLVTHKAIMTLYGHVTLHMLLVAAQVIKGPLARLALELFAAVLVHRDVSQYVSP